ncbi:hypothetical protein BCR35DRAFT_301592 [Leucosporidium creatinivorum]|uniref:Uncharacterized protein n=1 Tax=Leucosporidium creatinivorum TaxID=106004 RepID=A0A1Y2FY49_9BASI|nr:hypothetical protein BCR35DRAFT_301592 [Leucosporidium creatinivorum]
MEYESWWEQAEALVDLGDGKPAKSPGKTRESPAELASRRDRCVSLAPSTPRKGGTNAEEEGRRPSPTPTLASTPISRPNSAHLLPRRPSASSIETGLSVEERQKEMLRGVLLNPAHKGASLPSRGPPSPRPGLSILTNARSSSTPADSPVKPRPFGLSSSTTASSPASPYPSSTIAASSPSKTNLRRVSRAGVSGIKDFLLRLRLKASEELAASVNTPQLNQLARAGGTAPEDARRSVSDPTRSLTPSSSRYGSLRRRQPPSSSLQTPPKQQQRWSRAGSSSSEEEDWDKESSPPSAVGTISAAGGGGGRAMMVRTRTQSSAGGVEMGERMVLTTEAMPSLLLKVGEVKERCEECVGRLKGLTV